MTEQGSILPSEPAARSLAWQTARRQLSQPLGPSLCRGIRPAPPISSGGGIFGGTWCSLLPKLPERGNNKSQYTAQFAGWVTESVHGGKEKRLGPCWGSAICHSPELSRAGTRNRWAAHAEPGLGVHGASAQGLQQHEPQGFRSSAQRPGMEQLL